ncbi:hypothetical protein ACWD3I_08125 [Streptomyces sp. NPDC002817]|uniref:hypothetical protein n=1 Tax=Streptomyces sp. NPDC088357 TaxID=3154655 RepID=UPI003430CE3C
MTSNSPDRPATAHPGTPVRGRPHPPRHRQGPSPEEGELLRPLTRRQIADRMAELGELYTQTTPSGPRTPRTSNHSARWDTSARGSASNSSAPSIQARSAAFRRRLADHMRRPGFELLVAETTRPSGATVLTACAYGFPVLGDDAWWQELDGHLPANLPGLAAPGGLFVIGDILVERRVRTQDQSREWNLARRLQKRLLSDHTAAVGVMLVDRGDTDTFEALLSWGWHCLPTAGVRGASRAADRRLLVLR